jgi:predicted PhzF superfamily epimerase YddE/YHI9
VMFGSQSGLLSVKRDKTSKNFMGLMDFPSWKPTRVDEPPAGLKHMLGVAEIVSVHKSRDYLIELPSEDAVAAAKPDFTAIKNAGEKIIITAPGKKVDFVSRFFAPSAGVDEDPVTGSAHSQLIPYWSEKLHKAKMNALQLSRRGGEIYCEQLNEKRVIIGGTCAFYMQGQVRISKPERK